MQLAKVGGGKKSGNSHVKRRRCCQRRVHTAAVHEVQRTEIPKSGEAVRKPRWKWLVVGSGVQGQAKVENVVAEMGCFEMKEGQPRRQCTSVDFNDTENMRPAYVVPCMTYKRASCKARRHAFHGVDMRVTVATTVETRNNLEDQFGRQLLRKG